MQAAPAARIGLVGLGDFLATCLDTARAVFRRPFQFREFVGQFWFIVSVSMIPAALASIPLIVITFYEMTLLLEAVGAKDLSGAGVGVAVVKEAAPIIGVLILSGASATAICADLGARTIRDEISAMQVMGVDPIHRLVKARVLAITCVALLLNGFNTIIGLVFGYITAVYMQGVSPGLWVANLSLLITPIDFLTSEIKAAVFGLIAGLIACHLGLRAKGGPRGVADATTMTVVLSFLLLFITNTLISTIYIQLAGQA
jgi:phospholipid/cholesterol/gamma-HCH transport system permease protein